MRKKYKVIFNIFLYLSFIFVAISLYKNEYLVVPAILGYEYLFCSFLCLALGFFINSIQWMPILRIYDLSITTVDSVRTFGLSVFGKYIPGKVWVHLGKSAQIAGKYGYSMLRISEISFLSQLVSLWVSLLFGVCYYVMADNFDASFLFVFATWLLFTLLVTTKFTQQLATWLLFRIFKKEYKFVSISLLQFIKIIPLYLGCISLYAIGFYLLIKSFYSEPLALETLFVFPLAMSLGVLAVIVPGGIGVRELALSGLLIKIGVSSDLAGSVAIASRLWFLIGEIFIFLLGLWFNRKWKNRLTTTS